MMERHAATRHEKPRTPRQSTATTDANFRSAVPKPNVSPRPTFPWLSRDEIKSLARTSIRARQLLFLETNRIPHFVDLRGWPVVTKAAIEGRNDLATPPATWKSNKVV